MESVDRSKRILISVDWFPPAFRAGGPIRSTANLATMLAEHAQVWVVTGGSDLGETNPLVSQLDQWVSFPTANGPIQVWYGSDINRAFWKKTLREIQPHVVHLNSVFSRAFTLLPLRLLRTQKQIKTIVAPRGMFGKSALGIKPLKKRIFLSLTRMMGWMDSVHWHASSAGEREEVKTILPRAQVSVAQNLASPLPQDNPARSSERWRVVIIGRIHRVKNLDFGLKALLKSSSARPLEVHFIGPVEDATYQDELIALAQEHPAVSVQFLGGLPPSELKAHFQAAHYLLSPTTQENFGHSIVEAWAHGCPVLISDRTPWRDLADKGIGWDWPLDPATWATGLETALAANSDQWQAMSEASRLFFSTSVRSEEAERANLALFEL